MNVTNCANIVDTETREIWKKTKIASRIPVDSPTLTSFFIRNPESLIQMIFISQLATGIFGDEYRIRVLQVSRTVLALDIPFASVHFPLTVCHVIGSTVLCTANARSTTYDRYYWYAYYRETYRSQYDIRYFNCSWHHSRNFHCNVE